MIESAKVFFFPLVKGKGTRKTWLSRHCARPEPVHHVLVEANTVCFDRHGPVKRGCRTPSGPLRKRLKPFRSFPCGRPTLLREPTAFEPRGGTCFKRTSCSIPSARSADLLHPFPPPTGFFAAITVESEDVVIDLNGFTLAQSRRHALFDAFRPHRTFTPFDHGQGPSAFGPVRAANRHRPQRHPRPHSTTAFTSRSPYVRRPSRPSNL